VSQSIAAPPRRRSLAAFSVYLFERVMPDAFVLAIGLTILVCVCAMLFAPHGDPALVVTAWYNGIFAIFSFAMQMIMILVTGHAMAHALPVQAGLRRLAALARTPNQAMLIVFFVAAVSSWVNWGFGLVIGAVLARELAQRVRMDYAWLVAAGYSGYLIWASGLSGSINLAQASHGNPLNIVEKLTGHVLPFSETAFASFTLIPTAIVLVLVPVAFMLIRPRGDEVRPFEPAADEPPKAQVKTAALPFARRAEESPIATLLIVALGLGYLGVAAVEGKLSLDANTVIFVFLIAGLALHGRPIRYMNAVRVATRHAGSAVLLYPIYGGIMGVMGASGLAEQISRFFVSAASAHTLPFLAYLASLVITFVVPSGGGHWAVQGPFTIPAAMALHASIPATTMAVGMGEQVSNMLQPFWVLPAVAIAGIGIQRVMGFTVVTFVVAAIVYGAALLVLV
jgi:short-chain fatty acids transporter